MSDQKARFLSRRCVVWSTRLVRPVLTCLLASVPVFAAQAPSTEILAKGGAGTGPAGDGTTVVSIPEWTVETVVGGPNAVGFTIVAYGSTGNLLPSTPLSGTVQSNPNFFCGGEATESTRASQLQFFSTADIAAISQGQVFATFAAQIGSVVINVVHPVADDAELNAVFLDAQLVPVGQPMTLVRTITLNDIQFQPVTKTALIPAGAVAVRVTIMMTRHYGGFCNAYVDDVSLIVHRTVSSFCSGDGSGTACPCGNSGTSGQGCVHSSGILGGGLLSATGTPSVGTDSIQLHANALPPTTTGLFFQGDQRVGGGAGRVFGDGLRCAGGNIVRLGTRAASLGAVSFGAGIGSDPVVSSIEPVPPGSSRHYQVWYRDSAPFCTPAVFNLTNGLTIEWRP